ncbi:cytochrome c oxidase cbb3-type subunit 1 [Spirosomataceae bacterium TFI 002]|nr:cytochrome c oxidase cbb3-type subunit 1 [Spirosomataceae bacterium TFI 002]
METKNILSESGIIITLVLLVIPVATASIIVISKALRVINNYLKKKQLQKFNDYLKTLSPEEVQKLEERKTELEFALSNNELSGEAAPRDYRGLINYVSEVENIRFIEQKKRSQPRPYIEPDLTKLILWYLGCATFWLLFGTTIGEYLGIKFVAPDVDHVRWLSFGRLRPVHTNSVFWGWASLAMIGLSYYVIPRVSNHPIASIKTGYRTLVLINASVVIGSIFLMAGINNGGGEYREYIWPVMILFGIGVLITLINFLKTIAKRTNKEIYVSNWYIISAMMFLLVITLVAYWPTWQTGLGETIVQGYYMHQGVGMWFMLFSLGLMYYFLPQQLNKPIYSYSLGILAFWAQILFYTLIGTHHFIFSAIPWWLQTIAIVGSVGMVIPVIAGTTNFLLTFNGSWSKLSGSYTLPFYLIGIIFYFTGSLEGTAEAFRFTNLVWHFTDFTVAHSHLTMYGIISFMLWGFIYTMVPRLTGKEPSQLLVGAHFWLALIGLMFYTFPLMYGSTLRGLMWMEGPHSFIESVELMAPYWLWRAIGGSLMWLSHILFAYNFYVMLKRKEENTIPNSPIDILKAKQQLEKHGLTN